MDASLHFVCVLFVIHIKTCTLTKIYESRYFCNLIVMCILYNLTLFEIEFKKSQDIFQNQLGIPGSCFVGVFYIDANGDEL